MQLEWTRGMTPERKEAFIKLLQNNSTLLERVLEILSDWERDILVKECSIDDFKEPNWANKQAFRNGSRSAIKKVKDLFTIQKG